ncbi:MAG: MFS transporter, partial [Bacteroidota bacterium]
MEYLRLLKTYPRYLGYGLLHYFFSGPGQTFYLSLFTAYWLSALLLNNVQFGWLYSGATLLSAAILPVVGKWLDSKKLRHFSLGVGVGLAAFCAMMAVVNHWLWLLLVLFGLRLCGQGLMPLTASTAIARYFEDNRGRALSLVGFGVSFAEALLPLLIVALLGMMAWQTVWLIMAGVVSLVFIPLVIGLVPSQDEFQYAPVSSKAPVREGKQFNRGEVLRDPAFYALLGTFLCVPFFVTGLMIHKNLLGEAYSWSEVQMAQALSLFGITRLLGNLFIGPLIDRFSALRVFAFTLLPMGLGMLGLAISGHISIMYVLFMGGGISASLNSLTGTAVWAELYGTAHLGAIRSMVSTIMVVSTAIASVVLGWALATPERISASMW